MRRKIIVSLMTILVICMGIIPVWAENIAVTSAEYITSEDGKWQYQILETDNGEKYADIYEYTGEDEVLTIPFELGGYEVRSMGAAVFYNNKTLKEITIPEVISSVSQDVFSTAYALEKIEVENPDTDGYHSVDGVFYNGDQLITYPAAKQGDCYKVLEGTSRIRGGAFFGCANLKKVVIPSSVVYYNAGAFSRCMQPIDIVLKGTSSKVVSDLADACWEMPIGTKYLVKTMEYKELLLNEMKSTEVYKDSTDTMVVELAQLTSATDLFFIDGSKEQNITISYTDTGYSGDPVNQFNLQSLYQQMPADTTDNVSWSLVCADTCPEVALTNNPHQYVCQVTNGGTIITYAGGNAVLKGRDESGHEIILNVKVYNPMESCEIANNTDAKMRVRVNEPTHEGIVITPKKSYAYNVGTKFEIVDTNIAIVEQDGRHGCNVTGVDVGTTILTATINDNGNLIRKDVEVTVSDYIKNCTVDPIPAQTYVGEQLKPKPVVRYKGRILTEGIDYSISYGDNNIIGEDTGWISINGLGTTFLKASSWDEYLEVYFDIADGRATNETTSQNPSTGNTEGSAGQNTAHNKTEITENTKQITGVKASYKKIYGSGSFKLNAAGPDVVTYTSSNKKVVTVGLFTGKVKLKGIGKAKITIKSGKLTQKVTITVLPKTPTKIKVKTSGKQRIKVSWKRDKKVSGYQIQYATNKKITKGKKRITIKKNKKTFYTIQKLKPKKKYFVRVRAYKTVKGKKYYSRWSKTVKKTIKNI